MIAYPSSYRKSELLNHVPWLSVEPNWAYARHCQLALVNS